VSAYDLSQPQLRKCVETIQSYRPKLIMAYPSVLEELARVAADMKARLTGVRAIVVSAEMLYPYQRELFEHVFGAPVYNRYGCREVGAIAQECSHHQGLHINSDRVLIEVVRDDFSPCAPGEVGNVLVTDLDNYTMPLVRYLITDRAAFAAPGVCSCGRGLPRLEAIEGRTLDVVRLPNGSAVGGTFWTILLRRRPDRFHGMEQFQIVQRRLDEVLIRYVGPAPITAQAAQAIRQQVAKHCGANFGVQFERVDRIAVNVAGKRRLVVNELAQNSGGSAAGAATPVEQARAG
jgi:phenylacetate-CoA ligase